MKTASILIGLLVALLGLSQPRAASAQALVDVTWMNDTVGKPGYVIIDIREEAAYLSGHIKGAINLPFVLDDWRVRPLVGINDRETERLFNVKASSWGLKNDTHVVLIHAGRTVLDASRAAFVFWYLRLMGHDRLSILNGGMVVYAASEVPLETTPSRPRVGDYHAKMDSTILARSTDVEALINGNGPSVDYRLTSFYFGVNKVPEVLRYGTVPGARNLPAEWLTFDGGGTIRPREQLRRLYDVREINVRLPHIAFSSTGELAAVGWFVAHEIFGNANVQLYERGIQEWSANPRNRMQRFITFD